MLVLILAGCAAQAQTKPVEPPEPPEEDETLTVEEKSYTFNPLEASKHFKVGNFYFKKGSYKAAALRYREATRWNPAMTEALLKLGESYERLKDAKQAREAYAKFLELEPASKDAAAVQRKVAELAKADGKPR